MLEKSLEKSFYTIPRLDPRTEIDQIIKHPEIAYESSQKYKRRYSPRDDEQKTRR